MLWVSNSFVIKLVASLVHHYPHGGNAHSVVDPGDRRKKSKGGTGIFQFAETVEEKAWTDEQEKKALQVRV